MTDRITVWIIDDDQINNLICKTMLNEQDWVGDVAEFTESKVAIAEFDKTPKENLPHTLLLDINMPGLSGWDLLNKMKNDLTVFQGEEFPCVILLTSSIDESDEIKAEQHPQVRGMLSKPLDIVKMKEICFSDSQE
jgi:CheY-like chemotaxis protein